MQYPTIEASVYTAQEQAKPQSSARGTQELTRNGYRYAPERAAVTARDLMRSASSMATSLAFSAIAAANCLRASLTMLHLCSQNA